MKLILLSTVLCCSLLGYAQELNPELVEIFGLQETQEMHDSNPGGYELFDALCDYQPQLVNGYNEKYESAEILENITLRSDKSPITTDEFIAALNSADFNILNYSIFPSTVLKVYKLKTGVYLILDSQAEILK